MRGQRLHVRQKYAESIVQLSRALELDPQLIQAYIMRAFSYEFSTPRSFEKAIADFTAVRKLDPKNAQALYERGLAYWVRSKDMQWNHDKQGAKRERQMAQKDFSAVIQLAGNVYSSTALIQHGRIFETEMQFELAARRNLENKCEAGDDYLTGKIAEAQDHKQQLSNPKEDR
jgi:tetratricopeptide (TPR) repeat protein